MFFIRLFFLTGSILFCSYAVAEPNKQALKYIREGNYEKAMDQILRSFEKDSLNPAANYLTGLLYFQDKFDQYDTDTAYFHTNLALNQWQLIDEKEQQKLERIEISVDSITELKTQIEVAAYREVVRQMSLAGFDRFFTKFDNDSLDVLLTYKRDSLAYRIAESNGTWRSYKQYMTIYPKSVFYDSAFIYYHQLVYEERAKGRNNKAIEEFLSDVPDSPYRNMLLTELLKQNTVLNDPQSYLRFIRKYPQSPASGLALNMLYHISRGSEFDIPSNLLNDSLRSVRRLESLPLIPFFENEKFGFFSAVDGHTVIKPTYKSVDQGYFCNVADKELIRVADESGSFLVSNSGQRIVSDIEDLETLLPGIYKISRQEKLGVILADGYTLVPTEYERVELVGKDFLLAYRENIVVLFSMLGQKLISGNFDDIYEVRDDVIAVEKDDKIALVNTDSFLESYKPSGDFSFIYEDIELFNNEYIIGFSGEAETLLGPGLEELIPLGIHEIHVEGKYAYTSSKWGNKIFDFENRRLNDDLYRQVLAGDRKIAVKKGSSWRLFYDNNQLPPELNIDTIYFLNDQVTIISQSAKRFILFDSGVRIELLPDQIVSGVRRAADREKTGYLTVRKPSEELTFYDPKGEQLFNTSGESIEIVTDTLFLLKSKKGVNILGAEGKPVFDKNFQLIEPEYQKDKLVFHLLDKGKLGIYIPRSGLLIKPAYDERIRLLNSRFYIGTKENEVSLYDIESDDKINNSYEDIVSLNDSLVLTLNDERWTLRQLYTEEILLDDILRLDEKIRYKDYDQIKFRQAGGYGLLDSRFGLFLPGNYNEILRLGSGEEPYLLAERFLKDSEFYIVVYFDGRGNKIKSFAYRSNEYDNILCEK